MPRNVLQGLAAVVVIGIESGWTQRIVDGIAKTGKPVKGGGSVSGKTWNNKGYAIQPKIPGADADLSQGQRIAKPGNPGPEDAW